MKPWELFDLLRDEDSAAVAGMLAVLLTPIVVVSLPFYLLGVVIKWVLR